VPLLSRAAIARGGGAGGGGDVHVYQCMSVYREGTKGARKRRPRVQQGAILRCDGKRKGKQANEDKQHRACWLTDWHPPQTQNRWLPPLWQDEKNHADERQSRSLRLACCHFPLFF